MIALILAALQAGAVPPATVRPAPAPTPTAQVQAVGETEAVASARDAADDPAIWRNPRDPAASLIVATDKQRGLNVYDLTGRERSSIDAGRVNNVDLRTLRTRTGARIIVAASDRTDREHGRLALFELDPATARLSEIGRFAAHGGEAYGLCLYQPRPDLLYAFVVMKDGLIVQMAVTGGDGAIAARPVRSMRLSTQSEGCVADDRTGDLYVAEEDVGLWHFSADPAAPAAARLIAAVDGSRLVADMEGLAIARSGRRGGYLVVSSQGDSAYTLFSLPTLRYAGRFRVTAGRFGATSDTDGIEISTASFGPRFPEGIMIAQDGDNSPHAQNFKLLSWRDVRRAIGNAHSD